MVLVACTFVAGFATYPDNMHVNSHTGAIEEYSRPDTPPTHTTQAQADGDEGVHWLPPPSLPEFPQADSEQQWFFDQEDYLGDYDSDT